MLCWLPEVHAGRNRVNLYVDKMLSQIIWPSEDGVEVKSFGHQKTGCWGQIIWPSEDGVEVKSFGHQKTVLRLNHLAIRRRCWGQIIWPSEDGVLRSDHFGRQKTVFSSNHLAIRRLCSAQIIWPSEDRVLSCSQPRTLEAQSHKVMMVRFQRLVAGWSVRRKKSELILETCDGGSWYFLALSHIPACITAEAEAETPSLVVGISPCQEVST